MSILTEQRPHYRDSERTLRVGHFPEGKPSLNLRRDDIAFLIDAPSRPIGSGRVTSQAGVEFRIARSRVELHSAFALVYQAYRKSGLAFPNGNGLRVSEFNCREGTDLFVAVQRGQVICTMSLIGDGGIGIPLETVFPHEVRLKRASGLRIAEVGGLAQRESNFSVLLRLIQLMSQRASFRRLDELLIVVHPRHVRFYQRFLSFEPIGGCRPCDAVCGQPGVGMSLNLNELCSRRRSYERMFGSPFPWETVSVEPVDLEFREELYGLAENTGTCSGSPAVLSEDSLMPAENIRFHSTACSCLEVASDA